MLMEPRDRHPSSPADLISAAQPRALTIPDLHTEGHRTSRPQGLAREALIGFLPLSLTQNSAVGTTKPSLHFTFRRAHVLSATLDTITSTCILLLYV